MSHSVICPQLKSPSPLLVLRTEDDNKGLAGLGLPNASWPTGPERLGAGIKGKKKQRRVFLGQPEIENF